MEHKDLWLVIGLTVILAVAVSVSTVSLTGDAAWTFSKKVVSTPSTLVVTPANSISPSDVIKAGSSKSSIQSGCKMISAISSDYDLWNKNFKAKEICAKEGLECRGVEIEYTTVLWEKKEGETYATEKYATVHSAWLSPQYCDNIIGERGKSAAVPRATTQTTSKDITKTVLCCK